MDRPSFSAVGAEVERATCPSTFQLLDRLFDELFPLLRSITGPGLRQSFDIIARHMPLALEIVPTGTRVFDWEVPLEWRLKTARLIGPGGDIIADAARCNLHVVNYSAPVDAVLPLAELQEHLHSLPALPDAIPYVTSYYKRSWGFCLKDSVRRALPPGNYRVQIDSAFVPGGVPVADCLLPGESEAEILLSSYLCHPSLANNELSGPLVLLGLYRRLAAWPRRRYSYRFVLNPETIGSLCYLHLKAGHLRKHMAAGMVLTCLGGPDRLSYKMSRRGDSLLDRVAGATAERRGLRIRPFDPTGGSDERQYCSPGFNFPMGQMARTIYGEYEGYHNSLDDKDFMSIASLVRSIDENEALLNTAEIAGHLRNLCPYGEPQLGRRDLYPTTNSAATWRNSSDDLADARTLLNRMLMVLNYSDGRHTLLDIAARMGGDVEEFRPVIEKLEAADLLTLDPFPEAP
jgi:aminopeptidase-like protein